MYLNDWIKMYAIAYKQKRVKPNYYKNQFVYTAQKYIYPYFEGTDIKDIKPITMEEYFSTLKNCSSAVQANIYKLLIGAFNAAVDNDYMEKNPMNRLELGEYENVRPKKWLSMYQAQQLYNWCIDNSITDIPLILRLGLRRGELLGLMVEDIDKVGRIIKVRRSVSEMSGKGVITTVKTRTSNRILPYSEELEEVVNLIPYENGHLFRTGVGNPLSPQNWHKRSYKNNMELASKELNIPYVNPHELRHTCGTILYQQGCDLRTIQKFMGHASIEVTSRIYIHDDLGYMRKQLYK